MSERETLFEILQRTRPDMSIGKVPRVKEQSAALVINGKAGGALISIKPNCCLDMEFDQIGSCNLGDYGLDDAPHGLSVWEGFDRWIPGGYECPQDGQTEYNGVFRRPTIEELTKIAAGEPLWPEPPEEPDVDEDQRTEL